MSDPATSDFRESEPRIYIPIVKSPADFLFTFGPLGYRRVDVVAECPIGVRGPGGKKTASPLEESK